jgi:hypothetical protein
VPDLVDAEELLEQAEVLQSESHRLLTLRAHLGQVHDIITFKVSCTLFYLLAGHENLRAGDLQLIGSLYSRIACSNARACHNGCRMRTLSWYSALQQMVVSPFGLRVPLAHQSSSSLNSQIRCSAQQMPHYICWCSPQQFVDITHGCREKHQHSTWVLKHARQAM